jgi:hypothetical protein
MALGELRTMFGLHLAAIVAAYNLDVESDLSRDHASGAGR